MRSDFSLNKEQTVCLSVKLALLECVLSPTHLDLEHPPVRGGNVKTFKWDLQRGDETSCRF